MVAIFVENIKSVSTPLPEDLRKDVANNIRHLDNIENMYDYYLLGEATEHYLTLDKMNKKTEDIVASYLREEFGMRYERLVKSWRIYKAARDLTGLKWTVIDRSLTEWTINKFSYASIKNIRQALQKASEGIYIDKNWWQAEFPPTPKKEKVKCPDAQVSTIPQPDGHNATLVAKSAGGVLPRRALRFTWV